MTVSIEGLRKAADFMRDQTCVDPKWLRDAADEIERLRGLLAQARDYGNRGHSLSDGFLDEIDAALSNSSGIREGKS